MKVCFFGIYNPEYSRNRVLISGFKQNGFDVFECRVNPNVGKIKKFINLYKEYKKIKDNKFDYVIVAFPGHTVVWLAWLLFGKNIIFDAFVSLYNSNVTERKDYTPLSLRGIKDWVLDWYSCKLADKVLLDTNEHIKYFSKTFGINKNKFIRVFVGSDDSVFYPIEVERLDEFTVHFHGTNTPLQGVNFILDSAKKLENQLDIKFNIIGTEIGNKYNDGSYKNVNFVDNIPYEKLPNYINQANICLGVFGGTEKMEMVIPNRVFEGIVLGKPVITSETVAIKELFTDNENIVLCDKANSEALVEKIIFLKNNVALMEKISQNAFNLFKEKLTPEILVKNLLNDLENNIQLG